MVPHKWMGKVLKAIREPIIVETREAPKRLILMWKMDVAMWTTEGLVKILVALKRGVDALSSSVLSSRFDSQSAPVIHLMYVDYPKENEELTKKLRLY